MKCLCENSIVVGGHIDINCYAISGIGINTIDKLAGMLDRGLCNRYPLFFGRVQIVAIKSEHNSLQNYLITESYHGTIKRSTSKQFFFSAKMKFSKRIVTVIQHLNCLFNESPILA